MEAIWQESQSLSESDDEVQEVSYGHSKCFITKFDTYAAVKWAIGKAHQLISNFNRSYKAIEHLIKYAHVHKMLMADCPTRWSSADLMISCILGLRQHVTTVCQDIGWNNLLNSDWEIMEHYRDLPFANYNTLCSQLKIWPFVTQYVYWWSWPYHLEEMCLKPGLSQTAPCTLLHELRRHFSN